MQSTSLVEIKMSMMNGEETYPLLMNFLPDAAVRKAEVELHETPENRLKGLKEIKKMLMMDKSTSNIDFEDDYLIQFLRHAKYNATRAFQRLRTMTIFKKKNSNLLIPLPDESFLTKSSPNFMLYLPKRCPDGCAIVLCRLGMLSPDEVSMTDIKRLFFISFTQTLRDPMTQINGVKIIHDFTNVSLRYLRHLTPSNLYLLKHASMDCVPARYKAVHIVNESIVMRAAWMIIHRFMTDKIIKRVIFHSDTEGLFDYFPRSILPPEYGGHLDDTSTDDWSRRTNKYQEQDTAGGLRSFY
ncbi:hypothetical protein CEXT_23031 [Caerostris extrusa]|uniref:CRAL-TRIO domain-containing protein n=1 Tax=Caerostris extrusa TaxID=172846 RepID=A0AAV4UME8_CAEEX|nr:hypothetical protein CEXT_23031 [Caerostris extrusa]